MPAEGIYVENSNKIVVTGNVIITEGYDNDCGIKFVGSTSSQALGNVVTGWTNNILVDADCTDCAVINNNINVANISDAGTGTILDGNLGDVGYYQEGDYGALWAAVAITGTPANGTRVALHNTNGGCATPDRWYVYSGAAWHYTVLT